MSIVTIRFRLGDERHAIVVFRPFVLEQEEFFGYLVKVCPPFLSDMYLLNAELTWQFLGMIGIYSTTDL
jgi:hypothetical protein